ncbi:unnamed protein product [Protopolystoma xenopodis]|uniref:Uncharacterized protein n=1 Tax=Protopolystoma xenopodis TaxID=117903 RepID=A0A3S5ADF8_9PLAT|nr:unnamed protein product [Protopolystoma xenopodis]
MDKQIHRQHEYEAKGYTNWKVSPWNSPKTNGLLTLARSRAAALQQDVETANSISPNALRAQNVRWSVARKEPDSQSFNRLDSSHQNRATQMAISNIRRDKNKGTSDQPLEQSSEFRSIEPADSVFTNYRGETSQDDQMASDILKVHSNSSNISTNFLNKKELLQWKIPNFDTILVRTTNSKQTDNFQKAMDSSKNCERRTIECMTPPNWANRHIRGVCIRRGLASNDVKRESPLGELGLRGLVQRLAVPGCGESTCRNGW